MEIAFLVIYGALVALVMPYVIGKSEYLGSLVPGALSIVWGVLLWGALTWTGMKYNEPWIWVITMFTMPVVLIVGTKQVEKRRRKADAELERKLVAAARAVAAPGGGEPAGETVYEIEDAAKSAKKFKLGRKS